jgi:hypothetical protein
MCENEAGEDVSQGIDYVGSDFPELEAGTDEGEDKPRIGPDGCRILRPYIKEFYVANDCFPVQLNSTKEFMS